MKTYIKLMLLLIAALVVFGWLLVISNQKDVQPSMDHRDELVHLQDSLEHDYTNKIKANSLIYKDSIQVIRTESKPEIIERFHTVFQTDTVWGDSIKVDIGQIIESNVCALRLDSCIHAGLLLDSALSACNVTKSLLKGQVKDYKQLDNLWTERYNLKWYQCIKKKRRIRKINKIKKSL